MRAALAHMFQDAQYLEADGQSETFNASDGIRRDPKIDKISIIDPAVAADTENTVNFEIWDSNEWLKHIINYRQE